MSAAIVAPHVLIITIPHKTKSGYCARRRIASWFFVMLLHNQHDSFGISKFVGELVLRQEVVMPVQSAAKAVTHVQRNASRDQRTGSYSKYRRK